MSVLPSLNHESVSRFIVSSLSAAEIMFGNTTAGAFRITYTITNSHSNPHSNVTKLDGDGEIGLHRTDFVGRSNGDQIGGDHDDSENHSQDGGDEEQDRCPEFSFERPWSSAILNMIASAEVRSERQTFLDSSTNGNTCRGET